MNEIKKQLIDKIGDTSGRVKRVQQQVNIKKSRKPAEKARWMYYGTMIAFIGLLAFSIYLIPTAIDEGASQLSKGGAMDDEKNEVILKKGDYYEELKQYLPTDGAKSIYLGGYEDSGSTIQTYWLNEYYVHQIISNTAISQEVVYRINGNRLELVYSEAIPDLGEPSEWTEEELNKLPRISIVLEAPIHKGAKYVDGIVTEISTTVNTTYGSFQDVLVIEKTEDDFQTRKYYASGFGLVKSEFQYLNENSGKYEFGSTDDLSEYITENEYIIPDRFEKTVIGDFDSTFHSPWKPSPIGKLQATIEGRGEQAAEEGIGFIVIENREKKEFVTFKLIEDREYNQYTPKAVEWIDEDRLLVIVGYAYGMVTMGGNLYELNIKDNTVTPIITNLTPKEEISSVTVNGDGTFTYKKHVYDTDNMEQSESHMEEGALPIPPVTKKDEKVFWKDFKHLEAIDLGGTSLKSLEGAEGLTNTENLFLGDNYITDLSPLKDLTNLKSVILNSNPIIDFSSLSKLKNLTFLSLGDTKLDSLEIVRDMKKLDRLIIFNTKVSDLTPLENAKKLTYLDIRYTDVTSIKPLLKHEKLKYLLLNKDIVKDWELLSGKEGLRISEEIILAE
ncbi:DUF4652 domain-containing protein [Psychrobacillus sp.]|uniref:DUF4652 domain-containing protein n=1 Tax=Psychrobacillus sp. TaxID=1871623 RepID=UPI0028BE3075|nr:DUF4652 domain-containing protein [Psychrobacillus sp.]